MEARAMSQTTNDFGGTMAGLPDPERDRQFYDGVPSRRLVAWFIDTAVIVAISFVAIPVFGILTLGLGFLVMPLAFMVLAFGYRVLTLTNRSATWGMRAMGIEFRRADGTRFDFAYAVMHSALFTAFFTVFVLHLVSMAAILMTRYQQSLPDLILRTTAINSPDD